jgi:hypothetical protein
MGAIDRVSLLTMSPTLAIIATRDSAPDGGRGQGRAQTPPRLNERGGAA